MTRDDVRRDDVRRVDVRRVDKETPADELRRHLAAGGVLAIPTESSYGLGADPRNAAGVEAIYRLKARDRGKPLPVVAADLEQLALLGMDTDSEAVQIAARFWPAPLTLVAPAGGPDGPWPASADGATLAARIPAHPPLRRLLLSVQCPLTATSANVAGAEPILDPEELIPWFSGHPVWIFDGGVLRGGPPSTIVTRADGAWRTLRPGSFPSERLTS